MKPMKLDSFAKQQLLGLIADALTNCKIEDDVNISFNEMSLEKGAGRVGRRKGRTYSGENWVRVTAKNDCVEATMKVYISPATLDEITKEEDRK